MSDEKGTDFSAAVEMREKATGNGQRATGDGGTDSSATLGMTRGHGSTDCHGALPLAMTIERFDTLFYTLDEGAIKPHRAHPTDAGLDMFAIHGGTIPANGTFVFDTGVHFAIPEGWAGLLTSKSGMMRDLEVTSAGLIDCDYRGSVRAVLFNHSKYPVYIKKGQKITQIVFLPISTPRLVLAEELDDTERGSNGFGSTGI